MRSAERTEQSAHPIFPSWLMHDHRRRISLIVVCFAMLMNILDQTIVYVALPTIQRELQFSQAWLGESRFV
jgi:hypothetical protein